MKQCIQKTIKSSVVLMALASTSCTPSEDQSISNFWFQQGQQTLSRALALKPKTATAKNIILFVGDGNGVTSVTATRIFDGQSKGMSGEENVLSFETFPYVALSKTYNTNQQTPDSAGTMTAIMTGVKTHAGVISVGPESTPGDCGKEQTRLTTLLEQAKESGKSTGIISTARITHATPAATYAHSVDRDWENDAEIPEAMKGCSEDIASQLITGGLVDIALGGGRSDFMPATEVDPEYPDRRGKRLDGRNLVSEWQQSHPKGDYVWNRAQFDQLPVDVKGAILGLFEPSHMLYEADRAAGKGAEPSLSEMTAKTIARLKQDEDGYFLMVEAGRIDHGHHAGNAYRALKDGQELAKAVQVAMDVTSEDDTLIVVTADHSHVLTMAGYPTRGNPILGKVVANDGHGHSTGEPALAEDGRPYTTLGYMNGPGYGYFDSENARYAGGINSGRKLKPEDNTEVPAFHQESLVPSFAESHGGEDVAIYARGPWAHLFHGVQEQNYIYHVMRQAYWPED